jgi:hypothetical protein
VTHLGRQDVYAQLREEFERVDSGTGVDVMAGNPGRADRPPKSDPPGRSASALDEPRVVVVRATDPAREEPRDTIQLRASRRSFGHPDGLRARRVLVWGDFGSVGDPEVVRAI